LLNLSVLECIHSSIDTPFLDANMVIYNESLAASTTGLMAELVDELCMSVPFMLQLTDTGETSDPPAIDEL